ncbi:MAG: MBL fold metallo-hydrolase [Clostridia bacterium]|nr:MBL fold metallo-hydrolase [Clostridia bacterium]
MKLSFYGACQTVTGSNYLLETNKIKLLIDCGLFQGSKAIKAMNYNEFGYRPEEIDYLLLTHAHIDHSGRIPLLYKKGFTGSVLCTKATKGLCEIMLPDSAHIQESNAEYKNRKRKRAGEALLEPLYTMDDAVSCLNSFQGVQYNTVIELSDEIKVRYRDAGHILGSACIEVWVTENDKTTKIIFSGDLGKKNTPIIKDPFQFEETDFLIMESTYGNKFHEFHENSTEKMFYEIEQTLKNKGTVIIPSFAVGRTQEMIYAFNKIESIKEKWNAIKKVPVYVDSPLAISATEVFKQNMDSFDDEAKKYILEGDNPLEFDNLIYTRTTDESKEINFNDSSKIIISSSGMCDAGRIKHHLKHNLWKENNTVLFVGYQAEGTLGRLLVDGAKQVKIFGETIDVRAKIVMIDGFSGHGDRTDLDQFIESFKKKPEKIFLVHGEIDQINGFSQRIDEKFKIQTIIPELGQEFSIGSENQLNKVVGTEGKIRINHDARITLMNYASKLKDKMHDMSEIVSYDIINKLDDDSIKKIISQYKKIDNEVDDLVKILERTSNE